MRRQCCPQPQVIQRSPPLNSDCYFVRSCEQLSDFALTSQAPESPLQEQRRAGLHMYRQCCLCWTLCRCHLHRNCTSSDTFIMYLSVWGTPLAEAQRSSHPCLRGLPVPEPLYGVECALGLRSFSLSLPDVRARRVECHHSLLSWGHKVTPGWNPMLSGPQGFCHYYAQTRYYRSSCLPGLPGADAPPLPAAAGAPDFQQSLTH